MSAASTRVALFSVEKLRGDFFPWVLAVVTGLDYFDNAIFSFFTSYIAGGVNASPDELVWSSSAYAVAAVLGILQQQWWVERFGYRRYVAGCMLLYSAAPSPRRCAKPPSNSRSRAAFRATSSAR
jgi:MFS family permease